MPRRANVNIDTSLASPSLQSAWIKREPNTALGRRIISATVNEFAEKGILGARIAEITKQAGTSDPAFYRYFPGIKHAALFIMREYYWLPLNLRLSHYQQVTPNPAQLFDAVVQALIQSTADDPSRPWLAESQVFNIVVAQMRNPFLLPESMLIDEYISFLNKLSAIIEAGQKQQIFAAGLTPLLIAKLLVNTLHGLLLEKRLNLDSLTINESDIYQVALRIVGHTKRA